MADSRSPGADHRCGEVDRLPRLGCLVATDVQLDDAVLAAPADLPHAQHMGHEAGVDPEPPHPGPVATTPHDTDPLSAPGTQPKGTALSERSADGSSVTR